MSSSSTALALAEAAIARLCHDLGGTLGAAANAVALARGQDGPLAAEALELAQDAAAEATARLRLARAMWSPGQVVTTEEIAGLALGLPGQERFHLDLSEFAPGPLPVLQVRAILAALLVAAEALRGPGIIRLAASSQDGDALVRIEGIRAAWPVELPGVLANPAAVGEGATARNIAPRLLAALAAAGGGRASLLLAISSAAPPPLLLQFPN